MFPGGAHPALPRLPLRINFGETRQADVTYKVIFCIFIVVGATSNLSSVVDFSDAMIFAMALINICGLYVLAPKVKAELKKYMERLK